MNQGTVCLKRAALSLLKSDELGSKYMRERWYQMVANISQAFTSFSKEFLRMVKD